MKLSQKRNCNGCKAGRYETHPFHQRCDLNFKVESINYEGIPQEPCYKPLTNQKWLDARKLVWPIF